MDYSNHDFLLKELRISRQRTYDIIEFGTYSGNSIIEIAKQAEKYILPIRKIFTIDSFQGLPREKNNIPKHEDWEYGAFDARKYFNLSTVDECVLHIKKKIEDAHLAFPVEVIPAYFSEIKPKAFIDKWDIWKLCYVNIDCDLYTSAMDALKFIFENDLLAQNGLIRYDDYHAINNGGECLAHRHICEQYGLEFLYIDKSVFQYMGRI